MCTIVPLQTNRQREFNLSICWHVIHIQAMLWLFRLKFSRVSSSHTEKQPTQMANYLVDVRAVCVFIVAGHCFNSNVDFSYIQCLLCQFSWLLFLCGSTLATFATHCFHAFLYILLMIFPFFPFCKYELAANYVIAIQCIVNIIFMFRLA